MSECRHEDDSYYEALLDSDHIDVQSPSELDGWNEEEGVLECTRESENNDFCVFHQDLTVENREEVREKLLSELKKETDEPFLLAEATLCRLIIEDITVTRPVWIVGTVFTNRFELSNVEFNSVLVTDQSQFDDLTSFNNVKFQDHASLQDVDFMSESEFHLTEFAEGAEFTDTVFHESCLFDRLKSQDDCTFKYTTFSEETQFASCRFGGFTNFYGAEFESETKLARVRDVEQIDAQVNSQTRFDGDVKFREVKFHQNATIDIKFKGKANMSQANFENCDLSNVDLSGSNLEDSNLSNTILYDTDLRGCKLMGCDLDNARLNRNTQFLGDPEAEAIKGYDHSIKSIIDTKRCYYDPKAEYREAQSEESDNELQNKARTVYRELQELGKSESHSQIQTRCFVRRKDMEKDRYWEDIWSMESGYSQPIVATARWLRAKFSRIIMLYGESPWRVLLWSLITILGFAISYTTFGLIENSDGVVQVSVLSVFTNPTEFFTALLGSIYYSALIFTNLSFGRYSPVGLGTYATAIETTIGLTMLALFFFVLGRRASK